MSSTFKVGHWTVNASLGCPNSIFPLISSVSVGKAGPAYKISYSLVGVLPK
jgi:hypothetical protein